MDFSDIEEYFNNTSKFKIKDINLEEKKEKLSNTLNDFIKKFKYKL